MTTIQFGGNWTDTKLQALDKYLRAYRKIFDTNEGAKSFKTTYVDGYAGTGERVDSTPTTGENYSLFEMPTKEPEKPKRGSVGVVLDLPTQFNAYLFIEKSRKRANELNDLIQRDYAAHASRCTVQVGDSNQLLQQWCNQTNWNSNRAVVFLDPYGMSVDWKTIETIAKTKAIDLWLLFPLGTGVNRMLTKGELPPANWCDRLTKFLGTEEWKTAFYEVRQQNGLFYSEQITQKIATTASVRDFFQKRLEGVFTKVCADMLPLRNSKNNAMYMLCFAAGNERGSKPAVKIANDLMKKLNRSH